MSSAYKAAASSAMVVGQSGAAPGNQTPHLARTKGLPRHLGLNGVLASRSGVEPPQPTFAGSVLKSVSREKMAHRVGVEPTTSTFEASTPQSVGRCTVGSPPWCRSRPLQLIWPLSALYKGAPLAGAVEKIGCGRWNRTTDVRLMRPTFYH